MEVLVTRQHRILIGLSFRKLFWEAGKDTDSVGGLLNGQRSAAGLSPESGSQWLHVWMAIGEYRKRASAYLQALGEPDGI